MSQKATKADLARRWSINRGLVSRMFNLPGAPKFTADKIAVDVAEEWREKVATARHVDTAERGQWRRELDRLKCTALQLEIDKDTGRLVERAEVEQVAQEDAALIKSCLLSMANTLAPQLVGIATADAAAVILRDWARSTLTGWAAAARGELGGQIGKP